MKRLRDEGDALGTLLARLATRRPDPFMRARVRARLEAPRRRPRRRLRPLGVVLMLMVIGSIASAMAIRVYQEHRPLRVAEPPSAPPPSRPRQPIVAAAPVPAVVVPVAVTPPTTAPSAPTVVVKQKRSAAPVTKAAPISALAPAPAPVAASAPVAPIEPHVTAPAAAPESQLVLDAFAALRQAHQPARAVALLERYLALYPHGALVAEAVSLLGEAKRAADRTTP